MVNLREIVEKTRYFAVYFRQAATKKVHLNLTMLDVLDKCKYYYNI